MARLSKRTRDTIPDDYFAAGPLEFARFGATVVSRSRVTANEHEVAQATMASQLPKVITEIDELVSAIARRVSNMPPDRLLHRAWWEFTTALLRDDKKSASQRDQIVANRMIDYVQSVIAAADPSPSQTSDVSEADWTALRRDVADLFARLSVQYQACLTAHKQAENPDLDMDLEEFRFRAELLWMNVRGKRYSAHERQALLDALLPHADELYRLFGLDAEGLVNEFEKILLRLTAGLRDAVVEFDLFRTDVLNSLANRAETTGTDELEQLREKLFEDPDIAARRDRIGGELFGMDLFDVEKSAHLPPALVHALTWAPGEDTVFLAPGQYSGWPLRIWPIMKRPFIKLSGRTYCFDLFGLFDNLYRTIQRTVLVLDPSYKEEWNRRQKEVSEELPVTYLRRLLPGARVYRSVYYRWRAGNGPLQWYEVDRLISYEDHLFVIEAKGGAFTYTSPATDVSGFIASLENLVQTPAKQGSRFLDYLENQDQVRLYDSGHSEVGLLCRADYRHVTIVAATLDAFTELAARAQHLKRVGVDVGARPVWVLSVDDLRVYADLFQNPLHFLHFVEQRSRAALSELVDLDDEFDHLGLYLARNDYVRHAAELMGNEIAKLQFIAYRQVIDDYYAAIAQGEPARLPKQELPGRLSEVLDFLNRSRISGRAEAASFLLDMDGDVRARVATAIDSQLEDNSRLGRARPLSTYGEVRLTVFSWSPFARRNPQLAIDHTQTVVAANQEESRVLLELEYSEGGELTGLHWQRVNLLGLPHARLDRLREAGVQLRRRRVTSAVATQGKIGVNQRCPCGSGKKYKRCCRH